MSPARRRNPETCNCTSGAGDSFTVYHCPLHVAARDLLDALRVFVQIADSDASKDGINKALWDMAITSARAAIAKATA